MFLIAQFGGYFGSYVYLAAVAPILCWRIDDWLRAGLPEVLHAYGDLSEAGWRHRRPAAPTAATRPAIAPARMLHAVHSPRARTGRPTRSPTG